MAAPSPSTTSSSSFPYPTLLRHPLSCPTTRPPAEHITNTWILEFILRQPIPDPLVDELFLSLHSHSSDIHPHLRKIFLLRGISSEVRCRSISERTLHSLELIVKLDRLRGITPSHRLKAAYCAAAVECSASAFLSGRRDFVNVVERIWMSNAAEGLLSEPFLEWGKKMERCLSSGKGGEEFLKRDVEDAMGLVREYLDEASQKMGPSFLEIVAAELVDKRMDLDAVARNAGKDVTEMKGSFEKQNDGGGISIGAMEEGGVRERSGRMADNSVKDLGVGESREEFDGLGEASKMQDADLNVNLKSGFQSVEVEVEKERAVNAGWLDMPDHSKCNIQQIDPSEVRKVKEALKKSCFDLRRAAEDPLPQSQAVAAAALDSICRAHALFDETDGQSFMKNQGLTVSHFELVAGVPAVVETNAGVLEKEKRNSFDLNEVEGNQISEARKNDAGPSNRRKVVASHSLFERNPTARTSEWSDDSLESSSRKEKSHLPSPMSRRTGFDKGKLVKRRAVKRWTPQEEQTLREAVAKYGKGNWKLILNRYSEIFQERTEIDLKDKWRNMNRHLS